MSDKITKEYMDGMHSHANGGMHRHFIIRQERETFSDGAHQHWFLIPTTGKPVIATTHWDGSHRHTLEDPKSDELGASISAHKHVVFIHEDLDLPDGTRIPAGEVYLTERDGMHEHGASGISESNADGDHQHDLVLGPELTVRSLDVGQLVELMIMDEVPDVIRKEVEVDSDRELALAALGMKVEKGKKYDEGYVKKQTEIQSVIFPKGSFSKEQARRYLDRNDLKASKLDETDEFFRFRQKDPSRFKRMRTITLPNSGGVKAIVGVRKEADSAEDIAKELFHQEFEKVDICKAKEEKQVVLGVVLEPEKFDLEDDIISAEEIEKAAHGFLAEHRVIKFRHKGVVKKAKPVESFIAPQDLTFDGPNGKQKVRKGSWVLGVHVEDKALWGAIKKKQINAFSVGGEALRTKLS